MYSYKKTSHFKEALKIINNTNEQNSYTDAEFEEDLKKYYKEYITLSLKIKKQQIKD